MQTIEDRLIASNRRPAGFDYLRLILSVSVVLVHTIPITGGFEPTLALMTGSWRPPMAAILVMFFALSGFLVAGSLERCRTLISFIGLRGIRLIPALMVETVMSAIIIGPLCTDQSLRDYFSDRQFWSYFLNIVGDIHYALPGVYKGIPAEGTVNGQLWTLPYEMFCYLSISAIALFRIVRYPRVLIPALVSLNAFIMYYEMRKRGTPLDHGVVAGLGMVQCFLYGICFYLMRKRIPYNGFLFSASVATIIYLLSPHYQWWGDYISFLPVTYATVYLGLLQPRRIKFILRGDYSYGIFLYGYAVQQSVVYAMGKPGEVWYINFAVSMPILLLVAIFSWWCIEKPALKLRPMLIRLEDQFVALRAKLPGLRILLPEPLPHRGRPSPDPAVQKAA